MTVTTTTTSRWVQPTDAAHRVTTLELLFDLVFVFAFTQVTQLMVDNPTAAGALRGLVVLALLWFAWCSYAWLGNQAQADEGLVRLTIVAAMAAMLVVALTIPESFADLPGGLFAPFVFPACYAVVRLMHLGCYLVAAGDDADLRRQLALTAVPVGVAAVLLVVGGALGPPYQTGIWAIALLVDYAGIWLVGAAGWRLPSPVHFAERHGLIVIVALGESLVAIGVGVAGQPVSGPVIVASFLGIVIAVSLWWLYFDVVAHVAEGVLARTEGTERSRLARDSYTYLHFPIVLSIIFLALGLKKVMQYVADSGHHDLGDALTGVPLLALYVGVAVHLLGHVAFRRRNIGTWNPHRCAVAGLMLVLIPLAWRLPALAQLALVAGLLAGWSATRCGVFDPPVTRYDTIPPRRPGETVERVRRRLHHAGSRPGRRGTSFLGGCWLTPSERRPPRAGRPGTVTTRNRVSTIQ